MRYTEVLIFNILARQCHYCHCIMSKCMETSLQTFCSSSTLTRIDAEDPSSLGGTLGLNDKLPEQQVMLHYTDMHQHVKV